MLKAFYKRIAPCPRWYLNVSRSLFQMLYLQRSFFYMSIYLYIVSAGPTLLIDCIYVLYKHFRSRASSFVVVTALFIRHSVFIMVYYSQVGYMMNYYKEAWWPPFTGCTEHCLPGKHTHTTSQRKPYWYMFYTPYANLAILYSPKI